MSHYIHTSYARQHQAKCNLLDTYIPSTHTYNPLDTPLVAEISEAGVRCVSFADVSPALERPLKESTASRAHADTYIAAKGYRVMEEAIFDWPSHAATEFHTLCDNQGITFVVITTTEEGVLCGISSKWTSESKWDADPEAVLFDAEGPHPALAGTPQAVENCADYGPAWGNGHSVFAGVVSSNFGDAYTQPSSNYPSWTLSLKSLKLIRIQVYRLVVVTPPPPPVTIADVQAIMTKMDSESMDAALYAIDVALELKADVAALTAQVAALSKGHDGVQAAIARMGAELADVKATMSVPKSFWARLLVSSSVDPSVPSSATAFMVTPTMANVDGLKDAVAAKMRLGVAAPLFEVWAHDAASARWVPVDEDCALVANDKATAYHVVVPAGMELISAHSILSLAASTAPSVTQVLPISIERSRSPSESIRSPTPIESVAEDLKQVVLDRQLHQMQSNAARMAVALSAAEGQLSASRDETSAALHKCEIITRNSQDVHADLEDARNALLRLQGEFADKSETLRRTTVHLSSVTAANVALEHANRKASM